MAGEDLINQFSESLAFTGTTGVKDIDRTVAATDFVQRSVASGATFPEIMESARKLSEPIQAKIAENLVTASEDRPLTGSQMIASAVLQIAPILIGASYSGKIGAGIGATAGVGGLTSYNKAIETRNERTRKSALAENKVLQGQLNNLNKQAMSAQEGMISQENKMQVAEFNRGTQLSRVRLADQLKKMEMETPNSEAFSNAIKALAGGESITAEDLAGMSTKERKEFSSLQTSFAKQGANKAMEEKTTRERTEAEQKATITDLARVPGTGFDPADKAKAQEVKSQFSGIDVTLNKLITNIEKNGFDWVGKNAARQETYAAALAPLLRDFAKTGAALTIPELPYLKALFAQVPSLEGTEKAIKEILFKGGGVERLYALRDVMSQNYGEKLLGFNYYIPKEGDRDNTSYYTPQTYNREAFSYLRQAPTRQTTSKPAPNPSPAKVSSGWVEGDTEFQDFNGVTYRRPVGSNSDWIKSQ